MKIVVRLNQVRPPPVQNRLGCVVLVIEQPNRPPVLDKSPIPFWDRRSTKTRSPICFGQQLTALGNGGGFSILRGTKRRIELLENPEYARTREHVEACIGSTIVAAIERHRHTDHLDFGIAHGRYRRRHRGREMLQVG